MPDNNVQSITIDNNGNKWIGTEYGGLTVFNVEGVVSVENKRHIVLNTNFVLYQNYPNPFNPTTKINYKIPHSSKVIIKIYNILGKEVKRIGQ